ncbi:MAG: DUF971 domain-containing protein [Verrucomicrobiota bacterium]
MKPEDIQAVGQEMAIRWSDGEETYLPMEKLRAASPSAEMKGERDLLGNRIGGSAQTDFPGVKVKRWEIVGGYALLFFFSDGHDTGIYPFEYLRRLGREWA